MGSEITTCGVIASSNNVECRVNNAEYHLKSIELLSLAPNSIRLNVAENCRVSLHDHMAGMDYPVTIPWSLP